jgi:hypothetical protein
MKKFLMIICFMLIGVNAQADAIYSLGNECPNDTQMAGTPAYTRQYYVDPALACVFDPEDNNITGTDLEADTYLEVFGTGDWVGLKDEMVGNFTFTTDEDNDDGTFTISADLASEYDHFAVGIKDGSLPHWAIFLLPAGVLTGDWGFLSEEGDVSHFALYGYIGAPIINPTCPNCPPPPPPPPVPAPEPASLLLFGTGISVLLRKRFARK